MQSVWEILPKLYFYVIFPYAIHRLSPNLKIPFVHFLSSLCSLLLASQPSQPITYYPLLLPTLHCQSCKFTSTLWGLCPEATRNLDDTYKASSMFHIPRYGIFLATIFIYSSHCSYKCPHISCFWV